MNTVQHGLRGYRTHDGAKTPKSSHPLDILSDILFDIKTENRQRDPHPRPQAPDKTTREDFREILKREMTK